MDFLNIVVNNEFLDSDFIPIIFNGEAVSLVASQTDMYDLLVQLGVFKSKGQAKKNWTRTGKEIPEGYNEFLNIGKLNKSLFVWNPKQ